MSGIIETVHGVYTRLDPPITINGVAYGAAIRFLPSAPPQVVCSGIIHSVSQAGSTVTVVVERAAVSSDFDIPPAGPGQGTLNVVYTTQMGGNIGPTTESARCYSHASERAFRGPEGDRAVAGADGFRLRKGADFPLARLLTVEAFAVRPETASWGTQAPTNTYSDLSFYPELTSDVADASGRVLFDPDDPFWIGILRVDSTDLARQIFLNDDGAEDPEWFPDFAVLAAGAYWRSPSTGDLRISRDAVDSDGSDLFRGYFVVGLREPVAVPPVGVVGIESSQGVLFGYGSGGDELATLRLPMDSVAYGAGGPNTDFDRTIWTARGACSIEIREGGDAGGRVVAVEFNAAGRLIGTHVRDGSLTTTAVEDDEGEHLRKVRCRREGDRLRLYVDDVEVIDETLADFGLGIIGLCARNRAQFFDEVGATYQVSANATAGLFRSRVDAIRRDLTLPLLPGRTLAEVVREPGVAMIAGASGRDRRTISGGTVIIPIECHGDRVRISYAPAASTGTGLPPRVVTNQENFATPIYDEETGILIGSSTDPDENRFCWRDRVSFQWELPGTFPGVPGDHFDIVRGTGGFVPGGAVLRYDLQQDDELTWRTLPGGSFLPLWWDGTVLMTETFRQLLEAEEAPACWQGEGVRAISRAGNDAVLWEERRRILEGMERLWIPVGVTGPGDSISGGALQVLGVTARQCNGDDTGLISTAFGWGLTRFPLAGWGLSPATNAVTYFATTNPAEALPTIMCGETGPWDPNALLAGNAEYAVSPYGGTGIAGIFWGSLPNNPVGNNALDSLSAAFSFEAIGFDPAGFLSSCPTGTVCLEAIMEVQVGELVSETTLVEYASDQDGVMLNKITTNGTVWQHWTRDSGQIVDDDKPDPVSGGWLGYSLIARRLRSENIIDFDDNVIQAPATDIFFVGSAAAMFVTEGTAFLDVTTMIQALINNRGAKVSRYELWPNAGVLPTGDALGLGGYALSLLGPRSASFTLGDDGAIETFGGSAQGQFTWATSAPVIRSIMGRFRLPNGSIMTLPRRTPPAMRDPNG